MKERTDRNRQNLANREGRIRGNLNARQKRMEEQLVRDITSLTPDPPQPTLRREEPRGGIPASRGYAETAFQAGAATGTGGGIASPLTEGGTAGTDPTGAVLDRVYHAPTQVYSSDGLLVWELTPVASITFRDANGSSAQFKLANPYAENP